MKLIKYSKGITSNSSGSGGTRGGSSESSSIDLNRTIWGLNDSGDDIDGSMVVNGNVTILAIVPPTYDEEDGSDGEDVAEETGGGNLNVELKITSNELEANDIYAKQHLYIPHPTTKAKTDIVELLKGYDSRITNNTTNIAANKTEIDALKGRVGTAETNITNLTTKVSNNTTNIQNNTDEIEKLKQSISDIDGDLAGIDLTTINNTLQSLQLELKIVKYGNYLHPIVLLSGKIFKYSYTSSTSLWHFEGCKSELITDVSISVDGGIMIVTPTFADNTSQYINSIHVTLEMSGDTANNDTATKSTHNSKVSINGRSDGAHWFEAYKDGANIKIREFHLKDGNNDSWGSDYWGADGGGIRAINITVIGYLFLMS